MTDLSPQHSEPPLPEPVVLAGARALFDIEEANEKLVRAELVEPREWDELPDGCGAHEWSKERATAVLRGVAWSSGFNGLMELARLILDKHYPEDIFTGRTRNPESDPGHQLTQALRACDDAMANARNRG